MDFVQNSSLLSTNLNHTLLKTFKIEGGQQLKGAIQPQGAKNEALQILCAVILSPEKITIHNIPDIIDVNKLIILLGKLGVKIEKLAKLRPAFDKKNGTLTAANSSFLTDGSAVCLLMTASKAKELNLTPKAEIVDYCFTGQRLEDELLLGPAFAMNKVLDKTKMNLNDIDVFEIHEAFA